MATLKARGTQLTDIVVTALLDSPHSYMVRTYGDVPIEQVVEAVRRKAGAEAELMVRQDDVRSDTWYADVIRSVSPSPPLQQQIDAAQRLQTNCVDAWDWSYVEGSSLADGNIQQDIAAVLEENRRLREACRAAANCAQPPDVLALLEEALKGPGETNERSELPDVSP